jgi:hypothetical protein
MTTHLPRAGKTDRTHKERSDSSNDLKDLRAVTIGVTTEGAGDELPNSTHIQRTFTAALAVLRTGFFSLGAGATASASDIGTLARPTGCKAMVFGDWGATATCSNHNGGSFRAIAICKDPETGKVLWGYGPWKQTGVSLAYCQGATKVTSAGIQTSTSNNS